MAGRNNATNFVSASRQQRDGIEMYVDGAGQALVGFSARSEALQLAAGRPQPSRSRSITARNGLALKVAAPGAVPGAWACVARGALDFPAPPSAPLAPTKTPSRWRRSKQRQAGGIHRPVAGIPHSWRPLGKISKLQPARLIFGFVTPLNDPRSAPIIDPVLRIEPPCGLVGCAANKEGSRPGQ